MMAREFKDSGIEWIGKIPKEWKMTKLFNLCTIKGRIGWNGLRSDEFKEKSYAYLVTGQDFHSSEIDWSKCYQIDRERYEEDPFIQLENGDLLITKDGTIGKVAKVSHMDKPACLNSGIFVLKQRKSTFVQNYLYWYLFSPLLIDYNSYINSGGTTIMHLYQNVFERFSLLIPPLPEQQRIADYLDKKCGEIDKLIALQEQMITQLTDYKQSVITEAVTKGLNPDAELVPSGIDWIGDVPKGWIVMPLKWILKKPLQYGANESGNTFDESLPRYVRITDILNNNLREDLQKQSLTEEQANGYILEDNDILFARSGATVGKAFIYKPKYGRCAFAGYLIRAQINNQNDSNFVYYYTQSSAYEEWKKQIFIQATIQNIGADRYSILDISIPPLSEQQSIATYLDTKCSEIDSLIAIKQQKIETLKDYKKSVIYEAVTGKMSIGETP